MTKWKTTYQMMKTITKYSTTYMRKKLLQREIIITTVAGVVDINTFRKIATSILNEYHNKKMEDSEDKRNRNLAAADLIRPDLEGSGGGGKGAYQHRRY